MSRQDTAAELAQCCAPLNADQAEELSRRFKALGDPVRLRLLSLIASHEGGEACVCELTVGFEVSGPPPRSWSQQTRHSRFRTHQGDRDDAHRVVPVHPQRGPLADGHGLLPAPRRRAGRRLVGWLRTGQQHQPDGDEIERRVRRLLTELAVSISV